MHQMSISRAFLLDPLSLPFFITCTSFEASLWFFLLRIMRNEARHLSISQGIDPKRQLIKGVRISVATQKAKQIVKTQKTSVLALECEISCENSSSVYWLFAFSLLILMGSILLQFSALANSYRQPRQGSPKHITLANIPHPSRISSSRRKMMVSANMISEGRMPWFLFKKVRDSCSSIFYSFSIFISFTRKQSTFSLCIRIF